MAAYNFAAEKLRQWPAQELAPELLVSGDDLIAMGLAPGPLFKEILTKVEDEQLEGRLTTRQQALDFIKERYPAK
jgi:poly(A) polymerase